MASAWTSAPELRAASLVSPAAAAEARAEAEASARYACQQNQNGCDQSNDCRQTKGNADPVGNRGKNDGDQNSNHLFLLRWVGSCSRFRRFWNTAVAGAGTACARNGDTILEKGPISVLGLNLFSRRPPNGRCFSSCDVFFLPVFSHCSRSALWPAPRLPRPPSPQSRRSRRPRSRLGARLSSRARTSARARRTTACSCRVHLTARPSASARRRQARRVSS